MIQIPPDLVRKYSSFLQEKGVADKQYRFYLKWLRYYLDFCHKYDFSHTSKKSLYPFIHKLKEKKQAENLITQSKHAVFLFFEMIQSSSGINQEQDSSVGNVMKPEKHSYGSPSPPVRKGSSVHGDSSGPERTGRKNDRDHLYTQRKGVTGSDWTKVFSSLKNAIQMRHYSPRTLKTYTGWTQWQIKHEIPLT